MINPNKPGEGYRGEPLVAVILLNWDDFYNCSECIGSVKLSDYRNYKVVVVDNGSTDGSQILLRERYPEIVLVENEKNLGFTGGFNAGIGKAFQMNADYMLCLNSDTVVDRRLISEMVRVGDSRTKIGALCPKELNYRQPSRIIYAGGRIGFFRSVNYGFNQIDGGQFNSVTETGMLCGAAMMLSSEALRQIGLFDARFFFDWEDKDMAVRLTKNGYKLLFVPEARLWHKRMESTHGMITPLRVYFGLRNGILFAKKHYEPLKSILFTMTYLATYSFHAIARSSNAKAAIKSLAMAILWHTDKASLPSDEVMVQILRREKRP